MSISKETEIKIKECIQSLDESPEKGNNIIIFLTTDPDCTGIVYTSGMSNISILHLTKEVMNQMQKVQESILIKDRMMVFLEAIYADLPPQVRAEMQKKPATYYQEIINRLSTPPGSIAPEDLDKTDELKKKNNPSSDDILKNLF